MANTGFLVMAFLALGPCFIHVSSYKQGFGSAKHAIIVGCDGLGGIYLDNATRPLPTIHRLLREGSGSLRARNQIPTISAPNWAAILTGQSPAQSGVFSNEWVPADTKPTTMAANAVPPISGAGRIPQTLWAVAKQQWSAAGVQRTVGVATAWDWIHFLSDPPDVDFLFRGKEDDDAVTVRMIQMIRDAQPSLMFVHLDEIDETGHRDGWGSPPYYQAIMDTDSRIGTLLEALETAGILADTLVVLVADHGGYHNGHGQNNQACVYVPIIFYGAGVSSHCGLNGTALGTQDVAPTVLHALGLAPGLFMRGRIVTELYCGADL